MRTPARSASSCSSGTVAASRRPAKIVPNGGVDRSAATSVASELEPSRNWLSCWATAPSSSMRLSESRSGTDTIRAVVDDEPQPTVTAAMLRPGPSTPIIAGLAKPLATQRPSTRLWSRGWSASVSSNDPGRSTTRPAEARDGAPGPVPDGTGDDHQDEEGDQDVAGGDADDDGQGQGRRGGQPRGHPNQPVLGLSVQLLAILDHLDGHRPSLRGGGRPAGHPGRSRRRRLQRRRPEPLACAAA